MNNIENIKADLDYTKSIVTDSNLNYCIYRLGFVFTSITEPSNIFDAIVIRNPSECDCWSPKKSFSNHTLEEHIDFINEYKIEKALIIADDISFVTRCTSLKYIEVIPADSAPECFDYSSLYKLPQIKYLSVRTKYGGALENKSTSIDYSKINGLSEIWVDGAGHLNYENACYLETLIIKSDKCKHNLEQISNSSKLKKIHLMNTKIKSLKGIKKFGELHSLAVKYCNLLTDISQLKDVCGSLRVLSIQNCPKITDFSSLQELKNLEHLELIGKNQLPNLDFLNEMKNLRTFAFSMDVASFDLTPCLQIPYVYSMNNKKQYNLKNCELPKIIQGNKT